ncbi:hypothetical protein HUW51_17455 [Adhaeribacter swui]|uniref:Uncharacterized protein n=1 Tax=Adhaeribacter swui TaxID=2086471 RepID=A0A7G7GB88_9BACT|nr:hypothetical protein [Adhaeribacter swui]QNF34422.1 hypothetical protein HUW51_17455 [Adhaeribacter swui]
MFNIKDKLTIVDVSCWMDGGTITLIMQDQNSQTCEIEFVQKVALKRYENHPRPGSLLINRKEVEVRSELEKEILIAVQQAEWGTAIIEEEKDSLKMIIEDCIDFVKSERYIELAQIIM